jgi:hypothetical protein
MSAVLGLGLFGCSTSSSTVNGGAKEWIERDLMNPTALAIAAPIIDFQLRTKISACCSDEASVYVGISKGSNRLDVPRDFLTPFVNEGYLVFLASEAGSKDGLVSDPETGGPGFMLTLHKIDLLSPNDAMVLCSWANDHPSYSGQSPAVIAYSVVRDDDGWRIFQE